VVESSLSKHQREAEERKRGEMTTAEKVIKTKVGLLELGKELGNASKACRVMGYSRDSFIDLRNRIAEEIEKAVGS
jgi:hypothetical protein